MKSPLTVIRNIRDFIRYIRNSTATVVKLFFAFIVMIPAFAVFFIYHQDGPDWYEPHTVFAWALIFEVRAIAALTSMWFIRTLGEEIGILNREFEGEQVHQLWLVTSRVTAFGLVAFILAYAILLLPLVPEGFAVPLGFLLQFIAVFGSLLMDISVDLYFLTSWCGRRDRGLKAFPVKTG